jgi:hypothetical protein
VLPPTSVERIFHLVWVKKPADEFWDDHRDELWWLSSSEC